MGLWGITSRGCSPFKRADETGLMGIKIFLTLSNHYG